MKVKSHLAVWLAAALLLGFLASCGDSPTERPPDPDPDPPTPGAPVVDTFSASQTTIAPGETVTLNWTLSGETATSVSIDNDVELRSNFQTSVEVTPATTTTYTLTATNDAGSDTATATVTVDTTSFQGCTQIADYTLGTKIEGELTTSDCMGDDTGVFVDYFKFTLEDTEKIYLLSNIGEINVYRQDRTRVQIPFNGVRGQELDLPIGTYFVALSDSSDTLYEITMTTTTAGFQGCSVLEPYVIGATITSSLSNEDCFFPNAVGTFVEYYSFEVTETSSLTFETDPGNIYIYRRNGARVSPGFRFSERTLDLTAGNYVVAIYNDGVLDYTFRAFAN